jgi:hypothetical protein
MTKDPSQPKHKSPSDIRRHERRKKEAMAKQMKKIEEIRKELNKLRPVIHPFTGRIVYPQDVSIGQSTPEESASEEESTPTPLPQSIFPPLTLRSIGKQTGPDIFERTEMACRCRQIQKPQVVQHSEPIEQVLADVDKWSHLLKRLEANAPSVPRIQTHAIPL